MQGRRLPDDVFYNRLNGIEPGEIQPGDYGRCQLPHEEGLEQWWYMAPNGMIGRLASERQRDSKGHYHWVEEHEDGTISVVAHPENSNSIKISNGTEEWHGYIRHGVWEKC